MFNAYINLMENIQLKALALVISVKLTRGLANRISLSLSPYLTWSLNQIRSRYWLAPQRLIVDK